MKAPLVVLGEPGMGKSELLKNLANDAGIRMVTARQLINRADPRSLVELDQPILIDALDEVPARGVGDAVDLVLQKLGQLGYPRFVLSCRVADWRSATSVAAIQEQYEDCPLELHLEELNRDEQLQFLTFYLEEEWALKLVAHFEDFGLGDLLGNPQTLDLIRRLPPEQELPRTRCALLELAVDELRKEHRDGGDELARLDLLETAGAAFATMILAGKSFVARKPAAQLEEDEISLAELRRICGDKLEIALDTRLFRAAGKDRFAYCHKRIAEFLGAAWLSSKADTRRTRKRLLQLFRSRGLVPANLRGLHAWLARDPKLAVAVIQTDPMGLIEYGDADALTAEQAAALFDALEQLAARNPWFKSWHDVRATGLVAQPLQERANKILNDRDAQYHLRAVIADQLNDADVAKRFQDTCIAIFLDCDDDFYVRRRAAEAIALLDGIDFSELLESLLAHAKQFSAKLAFEFIEFAGLEHFTDEQIIRALLAHDGLLFSEVPRKPESSSLQSFWRFEKRVPAERLDGLLNSLTEFTSELLKEHAGIDENQLLDFAYALILRRLEHGPVDPLRLWEWLSPYRDQFSYHRGNEKVLAEWFANHDEARRAIQLHVLFDDRDLSIRRKAISLTRRSSGLGPGDADVAYLLNHLNADDRNDFTWREVLSLVPHDGEKGRIAREAAIPFVLHNAEMLDWLDRLAVRQVPEWEVKQEKRRQKRAKKQAARFEAHRRDYSQHVDEMRAGKFSCLRAPAQAYLKLFRDIGDELEPHERIAEWLGDEIANAAHEGFDHFLTRKPHLVSAPRIAVSYAKGTQWNVTDIIIAALGERLRTLEHPFEGLTDERLMAGLFRVWFSRIDDHAGFPDLKDRLENELAQRGTLERAFQLFIVPQLKRRKEHVDQLYELMRREKFSDIATKFAFEWLGACPDLPAGVEMVLIDRLVNSGRFEELRNLLPGRLKSDLDDERRLSWDAVQVCVDFENAKVRLQQPLECELLWHLRARTVGSRSEDLSAAPLSPIQRAWIISSFRSLWPNRPRPAGVSSGNRNYWDAPDYLKNQISLLGEDTSDEARKALASLAAEDQDGYTDYIRVVIAEQDQKLAEQTYKTPTLDEIEAVLQGGEIVDPADLKAVLLDALENVQAKLRGDPIDWYKGFYTAGGAKHRDEEACRDELIKMLQAIEPDLEYIPEAHVADDKRVDIVVQARAGVIIPIEVKGQWHPDLWVAADKQLDFLYGNDWRAEHGIYLVLWFGTDQPLKPPPNGAAKPTTPEELAEAITANSIAAQEGRISVVVLDLTRPAPC